MSELADNRGTKSKAWKRYGLPTVLCAGAGLLYAAAASALGLSQMVGKLPIIESAASIASSLSEVQLGTDYADLAKAGGFATYRSYVAAALTIAVAVMFLAVIVVSRFAHGRQDRKILLGLLAGLVGLAIVVRLSFPSRLAQAVDTVLCKSEATVPFWDACAGVKTAFPLNNIVGAVGTAATVAAVFAVFIVASRRAPPGLPAIIGSAERCVTILLGAASVLLVATILMQRSYLDWAFAGFMVLDKPPPGIAHFIAGMSTSISLLQTAFLGVIWFVSLILLERSGQGSHHGKKASPLDPTASGFSVYNLSAILAPALSAIASNLLSG